MFPCSVLIRSWMKISIFATPTSSPRHISWLVISSIAPFVTRFIISFSWQLNDKLLSILCLPFQNSLWQLMVAFSCCLWISSHSLGFFCQLYKTGWDQEETISCIFIQCYANKDSRHFHPSVDLFQSMIWSYSTKWDVCWFVPKRDLVLQHKMGWCFYLQPDFLCWILMMYQNMFLQPVLSLLDIGESSWHNWASCPVRKSTWQIPLKQRDTMLNC